MSSQASRRVLRVITRLNVGGPARQAVYLNRALPALGYDSRLLTGVEGPREGRIDPVGAGTTQIDSLRRAVSPIHDLRALRSLRSSIAAWAPHVVHTHLAKAGTLGRFAAIREGVPAIVHTFHGHVLEGYFSTTRSRAFLEIERRIARRTDALIAVSTSVRDELLNLGIGTDERWHVIPVGLELEALLAPPPDRRAARQGLGLPVEGPAVGIVGRFVQVKDHPTFFRAAARLVSEHHDLTIVVAGDGELRDVVRADADRILGAGRARFLGWVRDLPSLYASLDVVVLTSRHEGTPVSLIEAGAARVPVVATRVGGVADVVVDGVTGLLVSPGDDAAIARAVGSILADPGSASALGRGGQERVRERYRAERLGQDLAVLYDDLLARKGPWA